jgi:hypothetical protein
MEEAAGEAQEEGGGTPVGWIKSLEKDSLTQN